MIRDLVILGTGVHSCEMAEIAERINAEGKTWNILGYIAPDVKKHQHEEKNGYPVIGNRNSFALTKNACFVPDNEWPRTIPVSRNRLVSLIDPTVFVSRSAHIGAGCVFYPHCYIGFNARIEDYVFCLDACIINHDDIVKRESVMAAGVILAGSVQIGRQCYLGQASTIRQCIKIGRNSLIGMGSVVVKNVPPYSVMAGNPARLLRKNSKPT